MDDHLFFENASTFNEWLAQNHATKTMLWLCYYKKQTGKPSITWEESVEEALCYGWIDGIRKSIDDQAYKVRFTPRRKTSIWSPKNLETVEKLVKENRMKEAGLSIYHARKPGHRDTYDSMKKDWTLDKSFVNRLKSNRVAWEYYQSLSPGVKNQVQRWVMTAKKAETKERRFNLLLKSCLNQELIPQLQWGKKK